jgi:hypothetical protein
MFEDPEEDLKHSVGKIQFRQRWTYLWNINAVGIVSTDQPNSLSETDTSIIVHLPEHPKNQIFLHKIIALFPANGFIPVPARSQLSGR